MNGFQRISRIESTNIIAKRRRHCSQENAVIARSEATWRSSTPWTAQLALAVTAKFHPGWVGRRPVRNSQETNETSVARASRPWGREHGRDARATLVSSKAGGRQVGAEEGLFCTDRSA